MNEEKNKWRELWLDSINELTTFELQRKTWLGELKISESPHWSFTEFISCYFDDLLYEDYPFFIDKNWITKYEYNILKEWHIELEQYQTPKKYTGKDKVVLNDKNWLRIIESGLKAKQQLAEIIPKHEKKHLLGMKSYTEYLN